MGFLIRIVIPGVLYFFAAIFIYLYLTEFRPHLTPLVKTYASLVILLLALFLHTSYALFTQSKRFRDKYRKLAVLSRVLVNRLSDLDQDQVKDLAHEFDTIYDYDVDHDTEFDASDKLVKEVDIVSYLRDRLFRRASDALAHKDIHNQNREVLDLQKNTDDLTEMVIQAVKENRISMYLQPIVKLPSRQRVGYELFSRLVIEDETLLGPAEYLEITNEQKLTSLLDNYLLFRGIQILKHKKTDPDLIFFANMSFHTFMDPDFMDQFIEFLACNRSISKRLFFELAQDDLLNSKDKLLPLLQKMQKIGFHFSLDHVDISKLPLEALSWLNFSFIKLRGVSLKNIAASETELAKWKRLKAELKKKQVEIIAEHIETEDELLEILELEIGHGQGYFFGEPSLNYRNFERTPSKKV